MQLNQNIGPTDVTLQAIKAGSLAMYPEYLNMFDTAIAELSAALSHAARRLPARRSATRSPTG